MHRFVCNICDVSCEAQTLDREIPSCLTCGSNVRFRWIVHALSMGLLGESLPLSRFPQRKGIRGMGLSDPVEIAETLARRFDYRNTCYHRPPQFDIMAAAPSREERFDFIIASEVLEHVRPPVQTAFDNLARLLSPAGFVVFSSPWELEGETVEHFPNLHDWKVVELRSGYVLVNRTEDGRLETFENLDFHGGPGSTLEMRIFSGDGLLANCVTAGLQVEIAENSSEFGIIWDEWSRGMVLRKAQDWISDKPGGTREQCTLTSYAEHYPKRGRTSDKARPSGGPNATTSLNQWFRDWLKDLAARQSRVREFEALIRNI